MYKQYRVVPTRRKSDVRIPPNFDDQSNDLLHEFRSILLKSVYVRPSISVRFNNSDNALLGFVPRSVKFVFPGTDIISFTAFVSNSNCIIITSDLIDLSTECCLVERLVYKSFESTTTN